jgi:outer membrane protein OmpA-like peptidoglycan-associated protein
LVCAEPSSSFGPPRRKTDALSELGRHLVRLVPLALLVLTGCATRDDLYVLLPGRGNNPGALTVTSGDEQRTLDQPYAAARVTRPGSASGEKSSESEVKAVFGPALAAQPARPVSFYLYFLADTDEFTPESKQVVTQIFAEIARRPAPEIVIIGHTDRVGPVPYNDALSLRRAERVREELLKLGIPRVRISVAGRGERELEVSTADEVSEPRNRRVEINVR